jgi:hypothetical protein
MSDIYNNYVLPLKLTYLIRYYCVNLKNYFKSSYILPVKLDTTINT